MNRLAYICVICLAFFAGIRVHANEVDAGKTSVLKEKKGVLKLISLAALERRPAHTYVITHGMGGIADRFYLLARAIRETDRRVSVIVVDWSPGATSEGGWPNPWAVAKKIDPTGSTLADLLVELHDSGYWDPKAATFIGESFGNYVNNRAAQVLTARGLTKVGCALAFNPASELGGYEVPVLSNNFTRSVAFITPSLFDTQRRIADVTRDLETPFTDAHAQHTYGITWLRERLRVGDISSLRLDDSVRPAQLSSTIRSVR